MNSHTWRCVSWKQRGGFPRTSEDDAEKVLDCKEALEGFSRRCLVFHVWSVLHPLESINCSYSFERCLFAFNSMRKLTVVSLNCCDFCFFATCFQVKPRNKRSNRPSTTQRNCRGKYGEEEGIRKHRRTSSAGGIKDLKTEKRKGEKCFILDMGITVADAIHYQCSQRSHLTGNYTGKLPVWHPIPSPN